MSNTSNTYCVVEKRVKQSQDVGGSSSKVKKPCAHKVILYPPPLVPLDEEEEELPLHIHSPIEHSGGRRTQINYMREDSRTIITQQNTPAMILTRLDRILAFSHTFMLIGTGPSMRASKLWLFLCNELIGLSKRRTRTVQLSQMSLRCVSIMGSRRSWLFDMIE
jgi:hypothetical protein